MTVETKIVFDLSEINRVIFECEKCGARIAVAAATLDKPPFHCPAEHVWKWDIDAGYKSSESPFKAFLSALAKLQSIPRIESGFKVFLEIDGSCARVSSAKD